ncbi:MAG: [FeFe] hydrogenase H-cluster radical SAM maturase HydG [Spirochaetes bacterium]|nr:[FeFe] hydrogenase H-cluster radical SAM maturase HydG [Spirochaetota bacterium]
MKTSQLVKKRTNFINKKKLYQLLDQKPISDSQTDQIFNKALKLKGLSLSDAAKLLTISDDEKLIKLLNCSSIVKNQIYGKRIVLFAPLYIANKCSNNCLYCGFRKDNKDLKRAVLSSDEIKNEVTSLLKEGHKRILMLTGESKESDIDYFIKAIDTAYSVRYNDSYIRRINVEIAPLEINDFKKLKEAKIGTYACFQETYDPEIYTKYHISGPKSDYEKRLFVMDTAMEAGIDDVGIGALFGLADYRFEVLSLIEHAKHLEKVFGCGPHTVSVPRLEPADNAPIANNVPYPVNDADFKKIIAVLRLTLPYTGIILSTRENESLRTELFNYGVSQISAGSRTNPGAYSEQCKNSGSQFSLGDHRSLDEVISGLIDIEHIPSFCTGCYRKGRVGNDFMDLAKPGLIKKFCFPNAIFTFNEYIEDYAQIETKNKGLKLIKRLVNEEKNINLKKRITNVLDKINNGERDIYF